MKISRQSYKSTVPYSRTFSPKKTSKFVTKRLTTEALDKIADGSKTDFSPTTFSNQNLAVIIKAASKNKELEEIGLQFHNLNAKGQKNLHTLFETKTNWKTLHIRIKSITPSISSFFFKKLSKCKELVCLRLTVDYEKENATARLIKKLSYLKLVKIHVSLHFSIRRCHLLAIGKLLKTDTLTHFNLKSTGWTDKTMTLLINGIRSAPQLLYVGLEENDFSSIPESQTLLTIATNQRTDLKIENSPDPVLLTDNSKVIRRIRHKPDTLSLSGHAQKRQKERRIKSYRINAVLSFGKIQRRLLGKRIAFYDRRSAIKIIVSLETLTIITVYIMNKVKSKKHRNSTAQNRSQLAPYVPKQVQKFSHSRKSNF